MYNQSMGFFDTDASDDDEDVTKNRPLPPLESFLMENDNSNDKATEPRLNPPEKEKPQDDEEEEEEDPLDAYMKTLNHADKSPTKTSSTVVKRKWQDDDNEEENELESSISNKHKRNRSDPSSPGQHAPSGSTDSSTQQQQQQLQPKTPWPEFPKVFWTPSNTPKGREWRMNQDITCTIDMDPMYDLSELEPLWGPNVHETLSQQGYHTPTLVQSQTIPVVLSGHNVVVTAATGQGKTGAYLWPVMVHMLHQSPLHTNETGPLALVVVPTRELAHQVHGHAKKLLAACGEEPRRRRAHVVVGGQGKYLLHQQLKRQGGVDVVVATPGRLLDVVSDKKGLSLNRVTVLVLDEADKLLDMGFEAQVRQLLTQHIRPDRQTLLCSATWSRRVQRVATEWMGRHWVRIAVGRTGHSARNVQQQVRVLSNEAAKVSWLLQLFSITTTTTAATTVETQQQPQQQQTLVFVATKEGCDRLVSQLQTALPTLSVAVLHGDKHASDRTATIRAFAKGRVSTLIATDVASRGLDIPRVSTVVNFHAAKNYDTHVHRIGRAGRWSAREQLSSSQQQQQQQQVGGIAYTLLTPHNAAFANVLFNAWQREGRPIPPELMNLLDRPGTSRHGSRNHRRHGSNHTSPPPSFYGNGST